MKRITAWLTVAALALIASTSFAGSWVGSDLAWMRYNSSNVTGNPNRPDTLWTTLAASKVDTTAAFTLDADNLQNLYEQSKVTADSLHLAHVVFYSDSSVASSVNFKASTFKLQANFSRSSANWQDVYTVTCSATDGQKAFVIPIHTGSANDIGIDLTSAMALVGAQLRFIVTGGASVAVPKLAVKVYK